MRVRFLLFVIALFILWPVVPVRAANNPRLKYKSIQSDHFNVTYYGDMDAIARQVVSCAEHANQTLAPLLGWSASEKTEILLTDSSDDANGSATPLPYNKIELLITAPDDLSPLGDVDDWYLELVTHEYTHILHTDAVRGFPAALNAILGKTFVPNQVQPRWLLEGLAVFEESSHTTGGRLRSSTWNMYMRTDVLENNVATLDQFSNVPRRFPQGNLWYLYGSYFLKWIAETYGTSAIRNMISEHSSAIIPIGINRSMRRSTGRTFEELYPVWVQSMQRAYEADANEVRTHGLREGVRLTFHGQTAYKPRWVPKGAWNGAEGSLLYHRDDGHSTQGLYTLPLERHKDGSISAEAQKSTLRVRTVGQTTTAFLPDGSLLFNSVDIYDNLWAYNDLFLLGPNSIEQRGIERHRKRLTNGFRAREADVSRDGRHVVFVTNHHGTSYLQTADLADGTIKNVHVLVPSKPLEQVFAPRWSPDGASVAYSIWTYGGYRDIRVVDVHTGTFTNITHDRAIDSGPSFSPDGNVLYFHSDRTGVFNLHAWDRISNTTYQVTNVLTGAFQPEPSPDGRHLAYLGYTSRGHDLFVIEVDRTRWTLAAPPSHDRPEKPSIRPARMSSPMEYNPLPSLRPRAYSVRTAPGNFGQAFTFGIAGHDIAGFHAFDAGLQIETEEPSPQGSIGYTYGRLPFDVGARIDRTLVPKKDVKFGDGPEQLRTQEQLGVETSISYAKRGAFENHTFSMSYAATRVSGLIEPPPGQLDPYDTPHIPRRGLLGSLHLGWAYSNAEQFLHSVGPEKGYSTSFGINFTDKWLGSDYSGYSADAALAFYVPMPWAAHHTLALRASGGTSGGAIGASAPFYVGGFVDVNPIDAVRNSIILGGFALRGYAPVVLQGSHFSLFNAEYRFPIVNIDRGPSTLPMFFNRLTGNVFADYGSAFDDPNTAKFKAGIGAELWLDTILAYYIGYSFRLGYARGLMSEGLDKVYVVVAVPY